MDYQNVYDAIMKRASNRNIRGYTEKHHIIPDFMFIKSKRNHRYKKVAIYAGDPNDSTNIVKLTPKEHILSHMLLYKIYKGTVFESACANSLNIMLVTKGNRINGYKELLAESNIRKYEKMKLLAAKNISRLYKDTIIVKDSNTGEMIGRVSKKDPKYISGEYIFYQKGRKCSNEYKEKRKRPGLSNTNSKGFADDVYEKSFLECCEDIGFIASKEIWIAWCKKNEREYLTSIKKFRFGGNGWWHLYHLGETFTNQKYSSYYTRQKENWNHIEKVKHKWQN